MSIPNLNDENLLYEYEELLTSHLVNVKLHFKTINTSYLVYLKKKKIIACLRSRKSFKSLRFALYAHTLKELSMRDFKSFA